jgi:hypothetical protein
MSGIAFLNTQTGFLVGTRTGGGARALRIENATSATPSWIDVSPSGAQELLAVAADRTSGTAYAVGRDGGVYVLTRQDAAFKPVPEAMALVANGEDLFSVRIAASPTGSQVFIGGASGIVLRFDGSSWTAPKSQTSLTITDLAFLGTAWGYAVGGMQEGTSVIVSYRP